MAQVDDMTAQQRLAAVQAQYDRVMAQGVDVAQALKYAQELAAAEQEAQQEAEARLNKAVADADAAMGDAVGAARDQHEHTIAAQEAGARFAQLHAHAVAAYGAAAMAGLLDLGVYPADDPDERRRGRPRDAEAYFQARFSGASGADQPKATAKGSKDKE